MDVGVASKDYFSSVNTLAKKISVDIENTQEAYQELWHTLSKKDQDQVIDESIICPSAVIKYAHISPPVIPDNLNIHSWFTKSQLNLLNQNQPCPETELARKENEQSPSIITRDQKSECNKENVSSLEKVNATKVSKPSVLKPKIPPPPPPSKNCVSTADTETSKDPSVVLAVNDIPKTGFDFLDNW